MSELFYHRIDMEKLLNNRPLSSIGDQEVIIWELTELYIQMVSILADLVETIKYRLYLTDISLLLDKPLKLEYTGIDKSNYSKEDPEIDNAQELWEGCVVINRLYMQSRAKDRVKISFLTDSIYSVIREDTKNYIKLYHLRKRIYDMENILWKQLSIGKQKWPCVWPLAFDQFHPTNITIKFLRSIKDLYEDTNKVDNNVDNQI